MTQPAGTKLLDLGDGYFADLVPEQGQFYIKVFRHMGRGTGRVWSIKSTLLIPTEAEAEKQAQAIKAADLKRRRALKYQEPKQERKFINGETVHNWPARYADLPYFADLQAPARLAIEEAHQAAGRTNGPTCRQAAEDLAANFPDDLELSDG